MLAGDELVFQGYGPGATFIQTSPTTGEIRYGNTSLETITFVTPMPVDTDYTVKLIISTTEEESIVPVNTNPTFAVGGKAVTDFGATDVARDVALLPDGKIVVAGEVILTGGDRHFAILRYNPDGSLDTTFSGDGKATTTFNAEDGVGAVALQTDGKAIVVGYTHVVDANQNDFDFAIARYNTNGSLDTTFDGDGRLTTAFSAHVSEIGFAVAVQSDGRIVVAGFGTTEGDTPRDFAVARYHTNGSLDTSFDTDGKVLTDLGYEDHVRAIAIQPDGKIVAAGFATTATGSENHLAIARYNANGSLDTSFDTDGKRVVDLGGNDGANGIALQSDGKILLACFSGASPVFTIVRLNADGTFDTTFDGDGVVTTAVGTAQTGANDIAVQPDGKIVVVGSAVSGGSQNFAIVRYNANGSLDASFDGDGRVTTGFAGSAFGVALQADGRAVAAGHAVVGAAVDFGTARYNSDGALDKTFGPQVNTLDGTPTFVEGGVPVVMDGDVRIDDAELAAQGHYGGATLTLARHNGASTQDVFSATGALSALTQGAALSYSGVNVGTVTTNSTGTLVLTFNANATQARVDGVLQAIAYSNTSDTPPSSVQIDWTFSDGNTGTQGTGGERSATGSTTVTVASVNDAPTFVVGGKTLTDFGAVDPARDIALLPNGKILVAGVADAAGGGDFAIVRYNPHGSLDTTFSGDGKATTGFNAEDSATAIALQTDGKAIVVGFTFVVDSNNNGREFAIARYDTNGNLDTTFDGDGRLTTGITPFGNDLAFAVAIQSDGRIVVAGAGASDGIGASDFAVVRYNTDGSLDTSFDTDGKVLTELGHEDSIRAIAIQPDGKIVAAGMSFDGSTNDLAIARYNANGSLDTSFDADGTRVIELGGGAAAFGIALQSDGKILVAGSSGDPSVFTVARLNADGTFDTTFDGDGVVTTVVGTSHSFAFDIAVQPDGKIVVVGTAVSGVSNISTVVRYNANGSLDASFDGDGRVTTSFGISAGAAGVALQADGRIVVTGSANAGATPDFGTARYNSDGSLDVTFAPTNTLNGTPTFLENGGPVVLDADVRVYDAELSAQGHYGGATLTLARHNGASAYDVFSATGALAALTQGAALTYAGVNVGTVTTNAAGTLVLTFNTNATQARVDGVLQAIAYSNTSDTPPSSVQIDWTFSDGNSGAQGTGGALAATGSTTVQIVPSSDPDTYLWSEFVNGQVITAFNPQVDQLRFDDADIFAADVSVTGGSTAIFSHDGKTVTLQISLGLITTNNVVFDGSGRLIVGDNTTGTVGDAANNTIVGGTGNDRLMGLGGNDTLNGRTGADALDGGTGTDFASYASAASGVTALLDAPESNTGEATGDTYISIERLIGSNFIDILGGDGGTNELQGLNGTDSLYGRAGADTLQGGAGNDNLYGEVGADVLDGGADFDYARYDAAPAGVRADLSGALSGMGDAAGDTFTLVEGLVGSAFNDRLLGDALANTLQGRDGTDSLYGRAGADTLQGGAGTDNLYGEAGGDKLDGGADFDYARYDTALAAVSADLSGVVAGSGDGAGDTFALVEGLVGSAFNDLLLGDTLANTLQGRDGTDSLYGRAGADTLQGGAGTDNLYGEAGGDRFDGGADFDYSRYDAAPAGVRADLSGALSGMGDAAGDTFTLVEGLVGSAFNDRLLGDALANTLQGRDGTDSLYGRAGADMLQGGAGTDNLYGEAGGDKLDGGADFDYARYDTAPAGVRADLGGALTGTGDAAGDMFTLVEGLVGSAFNDRLLGDALGNTLQGRDGTDSLYGRAGADTLQGGAGTDNLYGEAGGDRLDGGADFDWARYDTAAAAVTADLSGAVAGTGDATGDTFTLIEGFVGSGFNDQLFGDALANTLQGRDGADMLVGSGGRDTLRGGNQNDDLDGGAGQDLLLGDAGNDKFRFKVGEANGDRVQDFNGNGVLAGDELIFQGYGLGATFIQTSPTTGEIRYAITSVETLTFVTPTVVGTDYTFI